MKALIIGVTGQDGSLLANQLLRLGIEVHGTFRRGSSDKFWRLIDMHIYDEIILHSYNLGSETVLGDLLHNLKPDLIFCLAGESFTQLSFEEPKHYLDVNAGGTIEQLEAIKNFTPEAKVFFASSSEIFEKIQSDGLLDEDSKALPDNPYGISKLTQRHLVRLYRERFGLQLFTGVLFPHESPYRSREFVTRKITRGLTQTLFQDAKPMVLGPTNMSRDWGAAIDYVDWMMKLLGSGETGDYVFATGVNTTVEQFLVLAMEVLEIDFTRIETKEKRIVSYVQNKTSKILIQSDPLKVLSNRQTYSPGSTQKLFSVIDKQEVTSLRQIVVEMLRKEKQWLYLT